MKRKMLNRVKNINNLLCFVVVCSGIYAISCEKSKELADDPYAGGKEVLAIKFETKTGDLEDVAANTEMQLKIRGLMKFKDDFKFFVNEIEANVLHYTDSTLNFVIPENASTGSVWVNTSGQTFFGPILKVGGKVSVDDSFKVVNGTRRMKADGLGTVYDLLELPNSKFWFAGSFNDYELKGTESKPIGGIVQIKPNGEYNTEDGVNFGLGVVGAGETIYSLNRIPTGAHSGKYIIAGSFTGYNSKKPNRQTINNITRLLGNGKLDTLFTTDIVNPKPAETWKNRDTIAAFNGGVDGVVRKTFIYGEQIYVIGNFQNYKRIYYPNSSYDDKVYDVTRMLQLARLNLDGSMDSTFHYNAAIRQSERGANGGITDAMMQTDGKLILVGNFTTFNNTAANRIVRLNLDGSVDPSFLANPGADGDISSIRYNETTKKIILTGSFTTFNGQPATGIIMLNANGSVDTKFKPLALAGGGATFAGQLNNGKIIVTGTFSNYGDYVRQGFMILEADGSIAKGYNNTGGFVGRVYDMIEKPVAQGSSVLLVGQISRFNATLPNNILRILIAN